MNSPTQHQPLYAAETQEKVITVILMFNDRETEAHPIVTTQAIREIAYEWFQMEEVHRVLILDDDHDAVYLILWDSEYDK